MRLNYVAVQYNTVDTRVDQSVLLATINIQYSLLRRLIVSSPYKR